VPAFSRAAGPAVQTVDALAAPRVIGAGRNRPVNGQVSGFVCRQAADLGTRTIRSSFDIGAAAARIASFPARSCR
jgi:hypothetical protein